MSIEDRMRSQFERAASTVPVVGLDFEETLTRGHRARRMAFVRAAGAAAIIIGLGFAGATSWFNDEAPRPLPPVDRSPSPSPTPEAPPTDQEIESVVRSWLQAIQDGDEDVAWALMTEDARTQVGRSQFDAQMQSALPAAIGGFADPAIEVDVIELEGSEGDSGIVATLSGRVERDGRRAFEAQPIPVRLEEDGPRVEWVMDGPSYTVLTVWTSSNSSVGPMPLREDQPLPIEEVAPEMERVYLSIDGYSPATRAQLDRASGTATVVLDRSFEAGRHIATIVLIDGEGKVYPITRVFDSAAP
jgi:hypothetical protein